MDWVYAADCDVSNTLISVLEGSTTVQVTRFYVAEMLLAIESIHALGYTHRDIKPDNWMFKKSGHLSLTGRSPVLHPLCLTGFDHFVKDTQTWTRSRTIAC